MVEKKKFLKIKLLIQFVKFGCVGISNTLISLAVYYLLVWIGCQYILAYAMGFLLSVVNAYFWNSRYVFTQSMEKSSQKAFFKMFLSYLGSFLLSTVLITIMVEFIGISEYLAPILRLTVTVPINFIINKVWSFNDRQ